MSIKTLAVITLIGSSSAPLDPGSPEYRQTVSNYAKEVLTTSYIAKFCTPYFPKIRRNDKYIDAVFPPVLWTKERWDGFVRDEMTKMKTVLDKKVEMIGPESFCRVSVRFFEEDAHPSYGPAILTK